VLRRPEPRTPDEAQQLAQLTAQQAERAEAVMLVRDCAECVRARPPARLESWRARATTSAVAALQRCAQGRRDDYAAVKAGVTVPWRNGPVAGHSNRLQMRKRQMVGRAHLALLSHRFVRVPRERHAHVAGARERAPPQDMAA